MHTVNISIKKVWLTAMVLMAIGNGAIAQDSANTAQHFLGLYSGFNLTQTGRFTGITYEYMAYQGKRKEIGLKASYTFAYQDGNLIWVGENSNQPNGSSLGLAVTGYLYTNPQKMNTGFFINGEAGFIGTGWELFTGFHRWVRPMGGLGFGWKWTTKKGRAIRWGNGLSYAGANIFSNASLTATTTLSIGF